MWTWLRRDRPRAKNSQHHDEFVLFEESLRQIEDRVVLCETSWAKKMVYLEAARLPLRGRQQIRQSLRVELREQQQHPEVDFVDPKHPLI